MVKTCPRTRRAILGHTRSAMTRVMVKAENRKMLPSTRSMGRNGKTSTKSITPASAVSTRLP
jgi:hypothetical protein